MLIQILLLIFGLAILIYGANLLVDGGSALAARLKVSAMVIGLTVVAFGTSAPELVVSVISSVKGESGIVFGNVIGSNIFNVLAVLGLTAVIFPIAIKKSTAKIETPILLGMAILLLIMFGNNYWSNPNHYAISRLEGIILLILFIAYMFYTFRLAKKGQSEDVEVKQMSMFKSVLLIVLGLAGLLIGGHFLVRSAVNIAETLGISQRIIAITIVSIGTSLPELVTSIVAARKKNVDLAVGNVVGSCFFNIFFILGVSSVIAPVSLSLVAITDVLVHLLAAILLLAFVFLGKGIKISRTEGAFMFAVYVLYILYLVLWQQ